MTMPTQDIVLPDDEPLSYPEPPAELQQALQLYRPVPASFRVRSDPEYGIAAEALKDRLRMKRLIVDFFAPLKQAAHEAHKRLTKAEKDKLDPLAGDEAYLKRAMASYKQEVEVVAAKARAEAEAKLRREAEDRQLEEAARLEAVGQTRAAEAVLAAPTIVPTMAAVSAVPAAEGVSYVTTWKAEVIDLRALILAVAGNVDALGHLLSANDSTLGAFARSTKGNVNLPGVRFFAETGVRSRT
jgi:hypothetical protein